MISPLPFPAGVGIDQRVIARANQWQALPNLLRPRGVSGVLLRSGDVICAGGQFDGDVSKFGQTERLRREVGTPGFSPLREGDIGTETLLAATAQLPDGSVLYAGGFNLHTFFGASSRATAIYKDGVFYQSYATARQVVTVPTMAPYEVALTAPGALLDVSPTVDLSVISPPPDPLAFPGPVGSAFFPGNVLFEQVAGVPGPGQIAVDTVLKKVAFDASAAGLEVSIEYRHQVAVPGPGVPAPLPAGRSIGSLFLSPDGTTVLSCLGFNGTTFYDWTPSATAELYTIATGLWAATGSMATPHASGEPTTGAKRPDGNVVVTGGWTLSPFDPGFTYATISDTTEIYDWTGGTWSLGASLTMRRSRHWLVAFPNGDMLLGGGGADDIVSSVRSVERYSAAQDRWSPIGDMLTPRSGVFPIASGTDIVLIGGFIGTVVEEVTINSAEAFSTATMTSRFMDPPMDPTFRFGSAYLGYPDGTVLAVGGNERETLSGIRPNAPLVARVNPRP